MRSLCYTEVLLTRVPTLSGLKIPARTFRKIMGWDVIERCTRAEFASRIAAEYKTRIIKQAIIGENLWVIFDSEPREITLFIIEEENGACVYKEMSEHWGPAPCDCPLDFLDAAPYRKDSDGLSRDFRERVKAYHRAGGKRRQAGT
jgi:hypothetical protein